MSFNSSSRRRTQRCFPQHGRLLVNNAANVAALDFYPHELENGGSTTFANRTEAAKLLDVGFFFRNQANLEFGIDEEEGKGVDYMSGGITSTPQPLLVFDEGEASEAWRAKDFAMSSYKAFSILYSNPHVQSTPTPLRHSPPQLS
jgi:hypothetical protein